MPSRMKGMHTQEPRHCLFAGLDRQRPQSPSSTNNSGSGTSWTVTFPLVLKLWSAMTFSTLWYRISGSMRQPKNKPGAMLSSKVLFPADFRRYLTSCPKQQRTLSIFSSKSASRCVFDGSNVGGWAKDIERHAKRKECVCRE